MNRFKAIKNNNQITYVEKSSKFTTYGFYVESNNEIKKIINELNKNNPKLKKALNLQVPVERKYLKWFKITTYTIV